MRIYKIINFDILNKVDYTYKEERLPRYKLRLKY